MANLSPVLFASLLFPYLPLFGQATPGQATPGQATPGQTTAQPEAKRLLWIVPNYRTAPTIKDFEPIAPKEKFKIASQDAFDRGTVGLAAIFAGIGQLSNSSPSFGQGTAGYAR